jgi:hypothetical protein
MVMAVIQVGAGEVMAVIQVGAGESHGGKRNGVTAVLAGEDGEMISKENSLVALARLV